ncbi:uncharacterized protein [Macrobrachium rosenbergii]|uniref:uncharacterized protein n=1 Tax=Macrobrachium rosenbergii TaxID=79674 RepID=UPI0034D6F2BD
MARCNAEDWKYQLPWVLLGLRTAPRASSDLSPPEKVYGEPLIVPGELVMRDRHNPSVQRLRDVVGKFAPYQRTYTDRSATFMPPGLSSATHVFVRNDAVRPPLTRPYGGPSACSSGTPKHSASPCTGRTTGCWSTVSSPPCWRMPQTIPRSALHKNRRLRSQATPKESHVATPEKQTASATASRSRSHRIPQLTSRSRGTLQLPSRYLV